MKILIATMTILGAVCSTQAAVINVTGATHEETGTGLTNGIADGGWAFSESTPGGASDASVTVWNFSGVDLDGDLTADSFSLTLNTVQSGGGTPTLGAANGRWQTSISGTNNSPTVSIANVGGVVGTASNGDNIILDNFNFTNLDFGGLTGTEFYNLYENGALIGSNLSNDPQTVGAGGSTSSFEVEWVSGAYRLLDVNFTATVSTSAIPEPATLGLVLSFGAGILVIRRRLQI